MGNNISTVQVVNPPNLKSVGSHFENSIQANKDRQRKEEEDKRRQREENERRQREQDRLFEQQKRQQNEQRARQLQQEQERKNQEEERKRKEQEQRKEQERLQEEKRQREEERRRQEEEARRQAAKNAVSGVAATAAAMSQEQLHQRQKNIEEYKKQSCDTQPYGASYFVDKQYCERGQETRTMTRVQPLEKKNRGDPDFDNNCDYKNTVYQRREQVTENCPCAYESDISLNDRYYSDRANACVALKGSSLQTYITAYKPSTGRPSCSTSSRLPYTLQQRGCQLPYRFG